MSSVTIAADVKRVIVTGANRGIGLELVKQVLLREPNAFVVLTSRDTKRGQEAAAKLITQNPAFENHLEVVELDVTNEVSVTQAAVLLLSRFGAGSFYALVNNAGVLGATVDTSESQIVTNVWGTKRVTDAFLPLVQRGGRIINVSSLAGPAFVAQSKPERQAEYILPQATVADVSRLANEYIAISKSEAKDFATAGLFNGPFGGYFASKALLNLLTIAQSNYYRDHLVVAVHPGAIDTDMGNDFALAFGQTSILQMGGKPLEAGTVSLLRLLFGEGVESGSYYDSAGNKGPFDKVIEETPKAGVASSAE